MLKPLARFFLFAILLTVSSFPGLVRADSVVIDIDAAKPGPRLNPRMYGIFLEEINTAVDGGLYAELIRNRGFEDAKPPEGFILADKSKNRLRPAPYSDGKVWTNPNGYGTTYNFKAEDSLPYWSLVKEGGAQGSMSLEHNNPLTEESPRSCRLEIDDASGRIGIANEGYWGIGVKAGEKYELSFWARGENFSGPLTATLEGKGTNDAMVLDSKPVTVKGVTGKWKQYKAMLTATNTDPKARFVLTAGAKGTVWFDMVSLFPAKTFRGRSNGMRPEIAQMLADLKPGFVRFPGGCVVEGATPENAYNWKDGIGPLEKRTEIWNVWDYRRTHGMGFYEYLQFCQDIKAEPLYVEFAGETCIYRNGTNVPMSEMQPVVDGFLDAIEYANGPTSSKWGKLRAQAGHRAPFNLKMMEIGNENYDSNYSAEYSLIYPQVKARAPYMTALACIPQRHAPTEMVDEHYYSSPSWFIDNEHKYDAVDRKTPPIYIAELAVTSNEGGRDKGNLVSALAEGTFLMGCERNADHVRMVSYAPLMGNVNGRTPLAGAPPAWHGMIYFDSSRVFGTVSYYLWKMFGVDHPTYDVATTVKPVGELPAITGNVGLGTWAGTVAEFKDVRVEKSGETLYASDFEKGTEGWHAPAGRGGGGGGRWSVVDGAYRQTSTRGNATTYVGNTNWSDYTVTLKARKISGPEGFIIVFGNKGANHYQLNLGGWGNSQHAIEMNTATVSEPMDGSIETNRWYDIKVELHGEQVQCYLDGKLIQKATGTPTSPLKAVAGVDEAKGDMVIKVINDGSEPMSATLNIGNVRRMGSTAEMTLLTSAKGSDNNSLDEPAKVKPVTSKIALNGPTLTQEFPPYSFTLLRFKAKINPNPEKL